jgi:hypothetical protein
MKLCAFLDNLDNVTLDDNATADQFNNFLKSLSSAVRNSSITLTWVQQGMFAGLGPDPECSCCEWEGSIFTPKAGDPFPISFELAHQVAFAAAGRNL